MVSSKFRVTIMGSALPDLRELRSPEGVITPVGDIVEAITPTHAQLHMGNVLLAAKIQEASSADFGM